jgi:DNA (cytosine-5)-methyltransferase 1
MGFPDDFIFKGTKTEIAKQIGNAVPPDLAGAIAAVVKGSLDASRTTKPMKTRRKKMEAPIAETVSA